MYTRILASTLERFATLYPLVGITGPRQSGKTTLAKTLFKHLPYVSLENLDIRLRATQDPRGFLANYQQGAIFDEVQHVPELLSYLQGIVDESPTKGRYVLTGSQNFALSHHIAQSLSGRIGMTTLLPLSRSELGEPISVNAALFRGSYPGLHQLGMSPLDFYPSYIQTYLERDVRQIKNIEDLGRFQTFVKLCAGRIGQLLNISSLAQDAGISHTAAKQWLTVLEASYLIFFLQPYHKNFNKRLTKMSKLYFCDTGLACSLLGLEQEQQVDTHYLRGGLFENWVILEILKGRLNRALPPNLYFWRDQTGHEVDLLADWGGTLYAAEIKLSSTLQNDYLKGIRYLMPLVEHPKGYLIYTGEQTGTYLGINLTPFKSRSILFEGGDG